MYRKKKLQVTKRLGEKSKLNKNEFRVIEQKISSRQRDKSLASHIIYSHPRDDPFKLNREIRNSTKSQVKDF